MLKFKDILFSATFIGGIMSDSKRGSQRIDWSKEMINWAQSEKTERELEEADRDSLQTINGLRKALMIDNDMLHTAFTL